MSQNHELTKIKFRIKALSEKTTEAGCSEAEALAALEKVGELLQQYNLTMDEIDIREQKCITVQYDTNSGKHTVASECMVAIAKFTDCRTWWSRRWDENWKKHVVGMKLRTQKTYRRIRSSSGYSKGSEAGGRVNLSRPIGGGSKPSGYLT